MPHDRPNDQRAGSSPGPSGRSRRPRVVAAVALALTVSLLGACGSADAGAGDRGPNPAGETAPQPPPGAQELIPTGPEDPCVLLEDSEVEEQFGGPVSRGAGGRFHCSWSIDDPGTGTTTNISVNASLRRKGMSIDATWAELESEDEDAIRLDGIGDGAYLVEDAVLGRALTFRSGDSILAVSARVYDMSSGTDEKLTALAKLIIERL